MDIKEDKLINKAQYLIQKIGRKKLTKKFTLMLLLSALALTSLIIGSVYLWKKVSRPVSVVKIEGKFHYLSQAQIQHKLLPLVAAKFFSLKLYEIKKTLLLLPWISSVELRRQWPEKLFIKIHERIPVAHWNNRWLIDQSGNIFMPENTENFAHLPLLQGVVGHENEAWEIFLFLEKTLKPLSLTVAEFTVDDTDSWNFVINGVKVDVGEHNQHKRIEAFTSLYTRHLKKKWSNINAIDLRYTNGVAVAWKNSK